MHGCNNLLKLLVVRIQDRMPVLAPGQLLIFPDISGNYLQIIYFRKL